MTKKKNGIFYIFLHIFTQINKWVNYQSIAQCSKTFQPVAMRQVLMSIVCNSLFRRTIPHQFRRGEIINQRARIQPLLLPLKLLLRRSSHPHRRRPFLFQSRRRLVSGHDHNYNNCKDTHADI